MKKAIFSWARTFFWEKQEKYFQEKENLSWGRRRGSTSPRRTSSEKGYFLDVSLFLTKKSYSSIYNKSGNMWQATVWKMPERRDYNNNNNNNIDDSWIPKETSTFKRFLWIDHLAFVCQKNLVSIENLRILFMAVIAWYHRCHLLLMRKI